MDYHKFFISNPVTSQFKTDTNKFVIKSNKLTTTGSLSGGTYDILFHDNTIKINSNLRSSLNSKKSFTLPPNGNSLNLKNSDIKNKEFSQLLNFSTLDTVFLQTPDTFLKITGLNISDNYPKCILLGNIKFQKSTQKNSDLELMMYHMRMAI